MSRGEWNDESWYDDGEFPPASRQEGRSGMVAAAVFSFVIAGFNALGASGFMCCFCFFALISIENQNQGVIPAEWLAVRMWYYLANGLSCTMLFFLQLTAGFGLPRGRPWSRTMTNWLAGYSLLVAAIIVAMSVYAMWLNGDDDSTQQWVATMIGQAVLYAGYAIVELSLLMQASVARRFR